MKFNLSIFSHVITTLSLPLTNTARSKWPRFARIPIGIFFRKFMSILTMCLVPSRTSHSTPSTRSHFFSKIKISKFTRTQPWGQQLHDGNRIFPASTPYSISPPFAARWLHPWMHFPFVHNSHKTSQRFYVGHTDLGCNGGIPNGNYAAFSIEQPRRPRQISTIHVIDNALFFGDCQWL